MKNRILVYGTLRKGEGLNSYMNNFKYLGLATVEDFEMYSNGYYPMIKKGKGKIIGEVFEIENGNNEIGILDRIESAYDRTEVEAKLDGAWIKVETYIYRGSIRDLQKINSGDWVFERVLSNEIKQCGSCEGVFKKLKNDCCPFCNSENWVLGYIDEE